MSRLLYKQRSENVPSRWRFALVLQYLLTILIKSKLPGGGMDRSVHKRDTVGSPAPDECIHRKTLFTLDWYQRSLNRDAPNVEILCGMQKR